MECKRITLFTNAIQVVQMQAEQLPGFKLFSTRKEGRGSLNTVPSSFLFFIKIYFINDFILILPAIVSYKITFPSIVVI